METSICNTHFMSGEIKEFKKQKKKQSRYEHHVEDRDGSRQERVHPQCGIMGIALKASNQRHKTFGITSILGCCFKSLNG